MLFNGHRAREVAHRTSSAIVVEGYLDAISVFQAGIKSVVATLGTAFTEEQTRALWRLAPEPVICFDGDRAGRAAAYRALDRILPDLETGWSFRFAFLPAGQDPDDLIKAEGAGAFRRIVDEALPMWDVLWSREIELANLDTPDGKAVLEKRLTDLINTIKDQRLKRLYALRSKVSLSDLFWRHERQKVAHGRSTMDTTFLRSSQIFFDSPARQSGLERIFLGLCVEFPDWALDAHERIVALRLRGTSKGTDDEPFSHQRFADALVDLITTEAIHTPRDVYRRMDPILSGALDYLHGRETTHQAMGYRLRERFPVMKLKPSPDFLERCFGHFLQMLELRELQDRRDELLRLPPIEFDDNAEREALALQEEVMSLRDRVHANENELAEEAQLYRTPSGGQVKVSALAA
jgi:DNA primase